MAIIRKHMKKEIDPLDKNKTELTHKITALASFYLDSIGCKPIETEVPLSNGQRIDIGSFTYPTMSELKKSKLLKKIISEECLADYKKAELFKYRYGGILTIGVEVKITLSDFKRDLDKKYDFKLWGLCLPTHLSYLAFPKSLESKIEKLNYMWGRIICSDNGERILKIIPPMINALHSYEIIDFIASVGIRRDHRTRYRAERDWWKSYRAKK